MLGSPNNIGDSLLPFGFLTQRISDGGVRSTHSLLISAARSYADRIMNAMQRIREIRLIMMPPLGLVSGVAMEMLVAVCRS